VADDRLHLTWADCEAAADEVAASVGHLEIAGVYGIPRGGIPAALLIAARLGVPVVGTPDDPGTLVVDDLFDSGATAREFGSRHVAALFRKPHSPQLELWHSGPTLDGWLVFPWEDDDEQHGPTDAVRRLIQHVGEDPDREGLLDTPKRVVKSFTELTAGYRQDPAAILATTFAEDCDQMVVVEGIEFTSMCEHHLLPFRGTATVAYIPGERVVGLSKIARLVECYARRLQVQERLTQQIADAMRDHLQPEGVGVVIRSRHLCMGVRGVRKPDATMVTSALHGLFFTDSITRAEFMALAHR